MEGQRLAAAFEGLLVSPESGAAFIAAHTLRETGYLGPDDEVVIFSTGSGLMHTDLIDLAGLPVIDPANLAALDTFA